MLPPFFTGAMREGCTTRREWIGAERRPSARGGGRQRDEGQPEAVGESDALIHSSLGGGGGGT